MKLSNDLILFFQSFMVLFRISAGQAATTSKEGEDSGQRRALNTAMFNPRMIRNSAPQQPTSRQFPGTFIPTKTRLAPLVQSQYEGDDSINEKNDKNVIIKVLPLPIPVGTPVATPVHVAVPSVPPFAPGLSMRTNRRSEVAGSEDLTIEEEFLTSFGVQGGVPTQFVVTPKGTLIPAQVRPQLLFVPPTNNVPFTRGLFGGFGGQLTPTLTDIALGTQAANVHSHFTVPETTPLIVGNEQSSQDPFPVTLNGLATPNALGNDPIKASFLAARSNPLIHLLAAPYIKNIKENNGEDLPTLEDVQNLLERSSFGLSGFGDEK